MNTIQKVNPHMITIARESRAMQQSQLSEQTGISKFAVNRLENSIHEASETSLALIAKELHYPRDFFYQEGEAQPVALSYRKRTTVPAKIITQIEANINIYRLNIEKVLSANLPADINIPLLDVSKYGSPAACAKQLRKLWKLPKGTVNNLSELLEANYMIPVNFDFETDRVDGRFIMALEKYPVIITNKRLLGDRQRFTLAYQLGHIVMHLYTSPGFERDLSHEANLFAAEFLMPEADIKDDLQDLSLPKLGELKKKWKASMQALLYRASDLGVITPTQKAYLLRQFNQQKIRKREPKELDLEIEQYKLLRDIFTKYRSKQKLSIDKFAAYLHLETNDFIKRYSF